jgi:hypothetical protein
MAKHPGKLVEKAQAFTGIIRKNRKGPRFTFAIYTATDAEPD